MKKRISLVLVAITVTTLFSGCNNKAISSNNKVNPINNKMNTKVENLDFKFKVEPVTFKITVESNGITETVSEPLEKTEVSNLKDNGDKISWSYKKKNIDVEIQKKDKYLDVSIKSSNKDGENKFSWPKVTGEGYMLPLNEGKYIPKDDKVWKDYLNDNEMKTLESFSMQFFAASKKNYSLLYIINNPYNNEVKFDTKENIKFTFNHEYPSINKNKDYGFRIYLTKNNPVDVAKTYKNFIVKQGNFKSLEDKAKDNKNIEKLYGAPHVYFWDRSAISEENVKLDKIKGSIPKDLKLWMQELLKTKVEDGGELATAFNDLDSSEYLDKYTKNRIIKGFNSVIQLKEFYNPKVFTNLDKKSKGLIDKGINKLNPVELIDLNKGLLKSSLGDVADPIEKWADANTVNVLYDMKKSGIDKMWVGLDDFQEGFLKPELVEKANELGYLIGAYDSYHSIHKPGQEKWSTAKFSDTSLYENATVTNKEGKKIEGFQGAGRKLNPTLAMPSVKERVSSILKIGLKFNSWFLDTDATGEVVDDYSKEHPTTEAGDIKARIERMEYLQKQFNMVVGSEGGNDFASKSIAFAHGIETPSFSWMDKDMSKNKDSKYYVGGYYSSNGGAPELFSKQIPIKDKYKKLFMDTAYTIPLYKLVYNDSVITSHWWGWGTLKIKDEVENRMLYEVLYNVPPLYHIDKNEWNKNKAVIVKHTKVWSDFSKKAITKEMTDFKILSKDRLVQMTKYGEDLKVIANFSNKEVNVEGEKIAAKSLIIFDGNNKIKYTP
ncbi:MULTISPECIES: glycoside hydrolase [unclassified Clostridium]|uniref:glycoside hydrolase n=1 Tax=unclassified Clostridium TaxID=2614128 RepID=UPI00209BAAA1|nr:MULTISPECIES: glycoside hydrolase [unclassified Clostridium]WAG68518.1 glycoside hydrolase [Clostridium sp. CF011]